MSSCRISTIRVGTFAYSTLNSAASAFTSRAAFTSGVVNRIRSSGFTDAGIFAPLYFGDMNFRFPIIALILRSRTLASASVEEFTPTSGTFTLKKLYRLSNARKMDVMYRYSSQLSDVVGALMICCV